MLFRSQTEEQLLAALEEIGSDGGDALAGLDFGGEIADGEIAPRDSTEAEEIPEVDSPLDHE